MYTCTCTYVLATLTDNKIIGKILLTTNYIQLHSLHTRTHTHATRLRELCNNKALHARNKGLVLVLLRYGACLCDKHERSKAAQRQGSCSLPGHTYHTTNASEHLLLKLCFNQCETSLQPEVHITNLLLLLFCKHSRHRFAVSEV